jgi:hypothetical protein
MLKQIRQANAVRSRKENSRGKHKNRLIKSSLLQDSLSKSKKEFTYLTQLPYFYPILYKQ